MIPQTSHILAAFALVSSLASITSALPAGSTHNVYLVRCDPDDCFIGICDPGDGRVTAAAYFRNGPITDSGTTKVQTPTTLARLSGYQPPFEGTARSFRFGLDGTFTTNIPATAKTAAKGSIVGDATLGTEPFVVFKDGSTKFAIAIEGDRYTCTTDYWAPSIDTGSGTSRV